MVPLLIDISIDLLSGQLPRDSSSFMSFILMYLNFLSNSFRISDASEILCCNLYIYSRSNVDFFNFCISSVVLEILLMLVLICSFKF